jgi:hypothetical protein
MSPASVELTTQSRSEARVAAVLSIRLERALKIHQTDTRIFETDGVDDRLFLLNRVTKHRFGVRKNREQDMNKNKIILFGAAVVVVAVVVDIATRSNNSTPASAVQGTIATRSVETKEINPFVNVAAIPAAVDPGTIRFEKVRNVDLASKMKVTSDAANCKDRQFRESDSTCTSVSVLEKVKAVEARYSYSGPAMSSGETVPGRDQFSVYFRPEELAAAGPIEKLNREQAESLFTVNTSRPTVDEKVIDKAHSQFCDGNYVDGNWMKKDSKCQDQVVYTTQTVPSPNMTVQVDVHRPVR